MTVGLMQIDVFYNSTGQYQKKPDETYMEIK